MIEMEYEYGVWRTTCSTCVPEPGVLRRPDTADIYRSFSSVLKSAVVQYYLVRSTSRTYRNSSCKGIPVMWRNAHMCVSEL